jgi:hypothetical protein
MLRGQIIGIFGVDKTFHWVVYIPRENGNQSCSDAKIHVKDMD